MQEFKRHDASIKIFKEYVLQTQDAGPTKNIILSMFNKEKEIETKADARREEIKVLEKEKPDCSALTMYPGILHPVSFRGRGRIRDERSDQSARMRHGS